MPGADMIFEALLTQTALIARPTVELDGEGGPKTPVYIPTGESVRVRTAPARAGSRDGLLGRIEEATHVIYTQPADIRVGDRLILHPVETTLSEDVAAGATELPVTSTRSLRDGQSVEIGGEELMVVEVGADTVTVMPGLGADREEGEALRVVARHEVLGVADEAGAGHHLRLTATATAVLTG